MLRCGKCKCSRTDRAKGTGSIEGRRSIETVDAEHRASFSPALGEVSTKEARNGRTRRSQALLATKWGD